MTKSTGVGRGGARANSGPKPKPVAGRALSLPSLLTDEDDQARDLAREQAGLAIGTLVVIARDGANEAARVSAAKALVEIGFGKTVAGEKPGKKALRQAAGMVAEQGTDWEELLN